MTKISFIPVDGPAATRGLDGAVAELMVLPGGSVEAEVRISGPAARSAAAGGAELGQVAYEAYLASCDGRSVRGEPLPSWEGQDPGIRAHWRAAADGVAMWLDLQSLRRPAT